ncbi:hypothetical protein SCLCIDRAFT_86133, partial [Scleroderma citrinum Foug A]
SQNSRKKIRQWQRWSNEIIPSLVQPYLKYRRLSRSLCDPVATQPLTHECQCVRHHLKIVCVNFDNMQSVDILVCSCATAAQQLLQMGYFPCAPLGPTLAVSLRVLTFVKQLFVCMPPNTSAWCEAFQSYLGSMGFTIDAKV